MAKNKTVVLDEIHVTFRIPSDLPDDGVEVVRETLAGDEFMSRLRRAVRVVVRAFPELNAVREPWAVGTVLRAVPELNVVRVLLTR